MTMGVVLESYLVQRGDYDLRVGGAYDPGYGILGFNVHLDTV